MRLIRIPYMRFEYALAVAMPLFCYVLSKLSIVAKKMKVFRVISVIGMFSLEIYLIHGFIYHGVMYFENTWLRYFTFLLATIAGVIFVRFCLDSKFRRQQCKSLLVIASKTIILRR